MGNGLINLIIGALRLKDLRTLHKILFFNVRIVEGSSARPCMAELKGWPEGIFNYDVIIFWGGV